MTRPRLRAAGFFGMPGGACPAYEAALDACRAAAASGVGGAWLRICEGHALARLGRAGEAEASYGAAQDEDPESAVVHLEMGNLLVGEGRLEDPRIRVDCIEEILDRCALFGGEFGGPSVGNVLFLRHGGHRKVRLLTVYKPLGVRV